MRKRVLQFLDFLFTFGVAVHLSGIPANATEVSPCQELFRDVFVEFYSRAHSSGTYPGFDHLAAIEKIYNPSTRPNDRTEASYDLTHGNEVLHAKITWFGQGYSQAEVQSPSAKVAMSFLRRYLLKRELVRPWLREFGLEEVRMTSPEEKAKQAWTALAQVDLILSQAHISTKRVGLSIDVRGMSADEWIKVRIDAATGKTSLSFSVGDQEAGIGIAETVLSDLVAARFGVSDPLIPSDLPATGLASVDPWQEFNIGYGGISGWTYSPVSNSRAPVVAISGPSGIGKGTLMSEIASRSYTDLPLDLDPSVAAASLPDGGVLEEAAIVQNFTNALLEQNRSFFEAAFTRNPEVAGTFLTAVTLNGFLGSLITLTESANRGVALFVREAHLLNDSSALHDRILRTLSDHLARSRELKIYLEITGETPEIRGDRLAALEQRLGLAIPVYEMTPPSDKDVVSETLWFLLTHSQLLGSSRATPSQKDVETWWLESGRNMRAFVQRLRTEFPPL